MMFAWTSTPMYRSAFERSVAHISDPQRSAAHQHDLSAKHIRRRRAVITSHME